MSHFNNLSRNGMHPRPVTLGASRILERVHYSYLIFAAGTNTILAWMLTIGVTGITPGSSVDFIILCFGITLTELVWYGCYKGLKEGSFYGGQHQFAKLVLILCFLDASGGLFAKFHAQFRPVYVEYIMPFSIPIMALLAVILVLSDMDKRLDRREREANNKQEFESSMEKINNRRDRTRAKRNDRWIRSIARNISQARLWVFTVFTSVFNRDVLSMSGIQAAAISKDEQRKLKELVTESGDGKAGRTESLELVVNAGTAKKG